MGARQFGPGAARFLQPDRYNGAFANLRLGLDPLTQNRYALAGANPINFVEVDGHYPEPADDAGEGGSGEAPNPWLRERGTECGPDGYDPCTGISFPSVDPIGFVIDTAGGVAQKLPDEVTGAIKETGDDLGAVGGFLSELRDGPPRANSGGGEDWVEFLGRTLSKGGPALEEFADSPSPGKVLGTAARVAPWASGAWSFGTNGWDQWEEDAGMSMGPRAARAATVGGSAAFGNWAVGGLAGAGTAGACTAVFGTATVGGMLPGCAAAGVIGAVGGGIVGESVGERIGQWALNQPWYPWRK